MGNKPIQIDDLVKKIEKITKEKLKKNKEAPKHTIFLASSELLLHENLALFYGQVQKDNQTSDLNR